MPLLVYDPRLPEEGRGRVRQEMALNIDIAPTLLALAGLDPSASMQGKSVLPLVRGESPEWRTEFFYEHLFEHPRLPEDGGRADRGVEVHPLRGRGSAHRGAVRPATGPPGAREPRGAGAWEPVLTRLRQSWSEWTERAR